MAITTPDTQEARDIIFSHVRLSRDTLISHLEEGNRDFDFLRKTLERYISMQYAADVLGEAR